MNKKGLSTWAVIAIIIGILAVAGVAVYGIQSYVGTLSVIPAGDFKGEFNEVQLPEDTIGTDLVANTSYAEDTTADTFNATFQTDVDLNGTDGDTSYLAFQFEVDGDMESLDIDGALNSATAVTELVIKSAYIISDEEGVLVDSDSNVLYTAEVNTDLDEFEFKLGNVADGKYVLVVKARSLATSTLASGDGLVDVSFDASTDGDVDEGIVYIING